MTTALVAHSITAHGQVGYSFGSLWTDTDPQFVVSNSGSPSYFGGLVFSWELATNELGTVLDPPVLSLPMSLVLTTTNVADPGDDIVEVYGVPEVAPVNYSGTVLPFTRNGILIGTGAFHWTAIGSSTTINFGITATEAANLTILRTLYWARAEWSGRIALSLKATGSSSLMNFSSTTPTLSVTETGFHTGVIGQPFEGRSRRCPRSGLPLLTDHAVEDGYRPGLWVRQASWDPKDELDDRHYYPSPNEGVSDDEVV